MATHPCGGSSTAARGGSSTAARGGSSTAQPYATRGAAPTQLTAGRRCNRPASALPLRECDAQRQTPRIRPASASQTTAQLRAGASAAGNLGELSLALSTDLEKWQRQWDLALQAVGDLRCAVTSAADQSELGPQLLARRQSGLSAQLALVEERLGVALTQAQHTRAQASALHQLQAQLEQSKQAQAALHGRASAATAAATQQQERSRAERLVLAAELRQMEQERASGAPASASTAAAAQAEALRAHVREASSLRDEVRHWQAVAQEEAARRFEVLGELIRQRHKVAVLAVPQRATTGSYDCNGRPEAALRARGERPSTEDPSERPLPLSQGHPTLTVLPRLTIQAQRLQTRAGHAAARGGGGATARGRARGAADEPEAARQRRRWRPWRLWWRLWWWLWWRFR